MKNHFYIAYPGNKREEVEKIYEYINFDGIDTIIEPFCGTCAISYFISTKRQGLKYILNDSNKFLKEMYEILIDDDRIKDFENEYNEIIKDITKDKYKEIINSDTVMGWFLSMFVCQVRPRMFPLEQSRINRKINLIQVPVVQFFRKENIEFLTINAVELVKEYKNKSNCLMLLDPPYINTTNEFYSYEKYKTDNIYEYLSKSKIETFESKVMLILEDNWIINLIFSENKHISYDKKYNMSQKKTTHKIITN
jgi:hypothetical protein